MEHLIRHILLLCLFCAFSAVMVTSINNLLGQKVGVSIGIEETEIEEPAFTICPMGNGSESYTNLNLFFSNLGNGTTFTIPSWIAGLTSFDGVIET
jgi:hypothetical protein